MTLREAIAEAAERLAGDAHLSASARRDAEFLMMHTLGISRAQLLAHPDRLLVEAERITYKDAIQHRLRHEPVQYIIGEQEFYGLVFRVTSDVLIPRPETEHLVEAVLAHFRGRAIEPLRIADIGTGSGAIAIALAMHLPGAEIAATDASREALAIAQMNARDHGVADRIYFSEADLLDIPINEPGGQRSGHLFDAIVSNPPYIALTEAGELHPQVREHEPHLALFAGTSGLDVYRRMIPQAADNLKPGGLLALEIGHGQRGDIADLLETWQGVRFIEDLQAIPRVALAQKPA
ncbi:release factor glutamine methyltransferase [Edaphobacter acidisoli]|uniref:Release factor glutamine methyltransferase n=1 Tax=Edaphobacter acidisoli TaxID=2040573 RepID=A0A916RUX4_9BACT|nr:peptide chain release factor N(5)-glutamine methyltransferase [Edaphobacter acidisoli]GGA70269.1 release factor glutamine methyltransferase [Edaphobacter acidisoli]